MPRNFYYRRQAEIALGSANFAQYVAANFAELGLTSAQSAAVSDVNTMLQTAWTASSEPHTRTPVAIKATRDAIRAMRAVVIPIVQQLYGNAAVSDAQLVAMGLLARTGRTPSTQITEMPVVTARQIQGHNVMITVRDAAGPVRGKLPQAMGAIIYSFVGPTPPSGAQGWNCEGPITRDQTIVAFDSSLTPGTMVWFAAQWFNTKGVGPGCSPVPAVIGVEGSLAA